MHWIMKSIHFLKFLDIEDKVKVYPDPPYILYKMANAEFPIVTTLLVPNRSLMIHVTGPKHIEGVISNVVNKMSWLLLGATPGNPSTGQSKGSILVMKEDNSETHTFSLKTEVVLNDTVIPV